MAMLLLLSLGFVELGLTLVTSSSLLSLVVVCLVVDDARGVGDAEPSRDLIWFTFLDISNNVKENGSITR